MHQLRCYFACYLIMCTHTNLGGVNIVDIKDYIINKSGNIRVSHWFGGHSYLPLNTDLPLSHSPNSSRVVGLSLTDLSCCTTQRLQGMTITSCVAWEGGLKIWLHHGEGPVSVPSPQPQMTSPGPTLDR